MHLSESMSPPGEEDRKEMSMVPYVFAVGSLMYVILCTRRDITYAVNFVS